MTDIISTPTIEQAPSRLTVTRDQILLDIPVDDPGEPERTDHQVIAVAGGRRGHDAPWWTGVWAAFLARYSAGEEVVLAASDGWHPVTARGAEPMAQLLDRVREQFAAGPVDLATAADAEPVRGVIVSIACQAGEFSGYRDLGLDLDGDQVLLSGTSRWTPETLRRMAGHLGTVAAQVAADDSRSVHELNLLDEDERRLIIHEWNDTDVSWPAGEYLELISAQALARPDTPAVAQGSRTISFAEFDRLTNQLAHRLRGAGVCDGDRVGLFCPRGADYVLGAIAILKAGAAIVALDPVNPDSRVEFMLADSAPRAILTIGSQRERLPDGWTVLQVDDVATEPVTPVRSCIGSEGISHLIYTSGSTGEPKAVLERRGAIENLVHWTERAYGVRPGDRASWLSTPGFAVQIMEWMPYLALGVTVCIPEATEAQSPERIRDWLVAERVTHAMLVAALAEPAWSLEWPADTALRIMVTTAERVHSWPPVDTPFRVVMTYGTTETTNALTCLDLGVGIDLTSAATPERIRATRPVPVGRPIANVRAYIVDDNDRVVPPGVVGRLLIGGAGLSAGYHERDELTAAKFHPSVIEGEDGTVYETGDLARYRPDGAIELLGRNDAQVKIRGFRVELGEVESAVAAHAAVREAVVIAHRPTPEDVWLVAYVTTVPGRADEVAGLRAELGTVLPFYMVPTLVVPLAEIPRLPNGKTDLRALPDPDAALRQSQSADYVAPVTELEVQMTRLWSSLFNGRPIGTRDNFFELGGHSLLAFQLLDGIRHAFDIELSTTDLYANPTAGELAALVTAGQSGSAQFADLPPVVPDPAARFEPFPLTESQQAMWIGRGGLVELGEVGCHGYFEWQSTDLDVARFERAWRQLVERHDALRTRVLPDGRQQVLRTVPDYQIPRLDLRAESAEQAEQRLLELREQLAHTVLPAESWPLFDVRLSLLPPAGDAQPVRIHLAIDFLIADAWSYFEVLLPDLVALYEDGGAGLAPLELTFRDYVLGIGNLADSELYRRSRWYWMDRLESLPSAPQLPQRPADQQPLPVRFDRYSARLGAAEWEQILALATQHGITGSGVLAAAYAEVLQAWSSEPSFCINFPLFNRLPLHPQYTKLIGDTTTTLLLAVEGAGETFAERAQALQKQLWTDLEHRYFSGVQVLRELTKLRGRLVPAMPIVMTSLVGYPPAAEQTALGNAIYAISQTPQVSLDFQVFESDGGLRYNWDHVAAVFPDGAIEEMFAAFGRLLARLTEPAGWQAGELDSGPYRARKRPAPRQSGVDANDLRVGEAWERYWATINSTGRGGDVLWDADNEDEMRWCLQQAAMFMDPSLPVVDLGCGNGRYSRVLAGSFGQVIGVDVSASAIEHARAESEGIDNLRFAVLDGSSQEALAALSDEIGPANVFVRGVLHVLGDEARTGLAATVSALIADRGVALVMEPAYSEGSFGYVGFVGGTRGRASDLVRPLEAAGVRHSTRFGPDELDRFFPVPDWQHLTVEAVTMSAVDPESDSATLQLPGFYAAVRRGR